MNITHGISRKNRRLYVVWYGMLRRCEDVKWSRYNEWGGRGIKVCSEWHNVTTFYEWAISNGYQEGLQLDRIDNNKDYSPSNCKFATGKENSRNTRNTIKISIQGVLKPLAEWVELTGISSNTLHTWVKRYGTDRAGERLLKKYLIK